MGAASEATDGAPQEDMDQNLRHVTDLALEQYRLNELPRADADRIERLLDTDASEPALPRLGNDHDIDVPSRGRGHDDNDNVDTFGDD